MQNVLILIILLGLFWVVRRFGKGEKRTGPVPPSVSPQEIKTEMSKSAQEPIRKPKGNNWELTKELRWKPEDEGRFGERLMVEQLKEELPSECTVLHDVWLHVQRGGTTQIDCMVLSPSAVFVIEVKSMHCGVWGRAEDEDWTLCYSPNMRVSLHNPRVQNQGHIWDVEENFPDAYFWNMRSIVAFADDAHFCKPLPRDVMHISEVPGYILRIAALSNGEPRAVPSIVARIRAKSEEVSEAERKAHVENLLRRGERLRNS